MVKKKEVKNLVIVESPSKAKTIAKFLGKNYRVVASVGHVRDLPKSRLGINKEDDFNPEYIAIRGKGTLIAELRKEVKKADRVLLATDPDREGEAIAWHLCFLLNLDPDSECRISFNEITKDKIREAAKNPRLINMSLVDAQQARRVLDRLLGYEISPILWRKLSGRLSAGRVQSSALKIICDREREILDFKPEEYWNISTDFKKPNEFTGKLLKYKNKKIVISNQNEAENIESILKNGEYTVSKVENSSKNRKPYAPFTTSTMQQSASNELGFSTKKTMSVAQQLYEGISIKGKGSIGLITYMRTDSVRISNEAKSATAEYITQNFGKQYSGNNFYSNKKKDIQDAHEAIRPSDIFLDPDTIRGSLTNDQLRLYKLIWNRFVASQMTSAKYSTTSIDIINSDYLFRATSSTLLFDGFLKVYKEKEVKESSLPDIRKDMKLDPKKVNMVQSFTSPPARFTEASLVKELEEKEIGRPSTYAQIITTLTLRKYILKVKKSIEPTKLGFTVSDLMNEHFSDVVNVEFTADLERRLDEVEAKNIFWKEIIRDFYKVLEKNLKEADKNIEKIEVAPEPAGELCEKCGEPMLIKQGRFGKFIACSGYPQCKNTKPIIKKVGVKCPKCGKDLIVRRGKTGKVFYGCSGYPECDQVFWYKPIDEKCPDCGNLLVSSGGKIKCSDTKCKYSRKIEKE